MPDAFAAGAPAPAAGLPMRLIVVQIVLEGLASVYALKMVADLMNDEARKQS